MMAGIVSYGTYIPTYRLPRDLIAKEWGTPSLGGERAVANFDEDSLTLAVNASIDAFGSREPQTLTGGFETSFGYNRFIAAAVQGILKKCNITTKDIANAAIAAPSQRTLQAALRGLGLDVKTQVQDTFWNTVGDAGTAQPLVLLAAA